MDFELFARSYGLQPGRIVADGRIHYCPTDSHPRKKNGRWFLAADGRYGWIQDWASMSEPVVWRPDEEHASTLPPPPDEAEIKRRRVQDRARRQRAIEGAREFYAACKPLIGGHPYLESHALDMTGCRGLRVDREGAIVVPMYRDGGIVSVQRIWPDGSKRFWKDAPTKGVSYTIGERGATFTVLCEGLATGLAIYSASRSTRVIIAFTAGNLVRVAKRRRWLGNVVIAADNDWRTAEKIGTNPGIEAAEEAAREIGCGVMVPEGIQGSDWCDWRLERVRARMASRRYGSRETESTIRRAVDAELAYEIRRQAVWLAPKAVM